MREGKLAKFVSLVCVSVFEGFRGADDGFAAKTFQYSLWNWWDDGQVT